MAFSARAATKDAARFRRRRAWPPPRFSSTLPTDFRDHHDGCAVARRRNRTRNWRVFVQRQMGAGPFVVRAIERHQPQQTRLIEHDRVIETLTTDGPDESLDEGILPRRTWGREHLLDPHRLGRGLHLLERVIAIVDEVSRRLAPRKGLAQLLGRPRRRRMPSDATCLMRRRSWARITRNNKRR